MLPVGYQLKKTFGASLGLKGLIENLYIVHTVDHKHPTAIDLFTQPPMEYSEGVGLRVIPSW